VKLSVVIPALDEAERIEAAIRGALEAPPDPAVELIVVDGGSCDATRALAAAAGARVLETGRGRARQLRAGVSASAGDVLLFLHADTRLPRGWAAAVRDALRDERVVAGAFRLRFDEPAFVFRFIEFGARVRSAFWRLPYGDQALFVRRAVLDAAGGIAPVPIFEDLDLVRLIRAAGRLALLDAPAWTSARRYERNGVLRQVARNNAALIAYFLNVDRARVARWYRGSPAA
jgi:rSAM/selenodomain-associated transferase 2